MKVFFPILFLFICLIVSAQDTPPTGISAPTAAPFICFPEPMPEYPGGEQAMMKFISSHIEYPDSAKNNGIQDRVYISFVIDTDGSLTDICIKKGVSKDIDAEALHVIKLLPKFKPGTQQGKPVKVQYMLAITFKLS